MNFHRYVALSLSIIFSLSLWGQTTMAFRNVTFTEPNAAYCMQKDENGLLWIGTGAGLFCYDGYRYYQRYGDRHALHPHGIQAMHIHQGVIYLGCNNGLHAYDIEHDTYKCLIADATEINAVVLRGTTILIGCKQGVMAWDIDVHKASVIDSTVKDVYSIATCGDGLLVGTIDGLYLLNDGRAQKRGYSGYVGAILPDASSEDCYWLGTEGNLLHYNAATQQMLPVEALAGCYVKSLAYDDGENALYVGTDNGLYVGDGSQFTLVQHDSTNRLSIQNNIICDIYIDTHHNLWVGHDVGISVASPMSACKVQPLSDITGQTGGNVIQSILQDSAGNIWLGGSDGLIRYNRGSQPRADWYRQTGQHRILHNRVRGIYNDSDGDVWIITDNGINLYDPATGELRNFIVENDDGKYSCRWAYDILMDNDRNIWVAAFSEGVFCIGKERLLASNGVCKADRFFGRSNGRLSGQHGYYLALDGRGRIWASSNGGIDRIDPSTMQVERIAQLSASSMIADSQQRIWMSFDGGIRCYGTDGELIHDFYFQDGNKPVRFVQLVEVGQHIWAFSPSDCRIIDGGDGLVGIFSLPDFAICSAHYAASDHQVLLGGMDNVMYLDCRVAREMAVEQPLVLAALKVNGLDYWGDVAPAFLSNLTLESNENNIDFCLTDVPNSRAIAVPYAYRLKGNSDQWLPLASDRRITLNGLPYGNYELEVSSIDGLGNSLHTVYHLPLTILPPWYLSLPARVAYALLAAMLIGGGVHLYYVRRRLDEEKKKHQRTIEQQQVRENFFGNLSNELKRLLSHIISPAEQILASSASDSSKRLTEEMRDSAMQINAMVRQVYDLNNSHIASSTSYPATIDLVHFCRGFSSRFEKSHDKSKHLSYNVQTVVPQMLITVGIVKFDSVFNIVMSYLSRNAQAGGVVQLQLHATVDVAVVAASASPLQLNIGNPERLFDRYQSPSGTASTTANSELYLAHEYMADMGGKLEVEYFDDTHTLTFKIVLPLNVQQNATARVNADDNDTHKKPVKPSVANENTDFMALVTSTIEKHIIDTEFNVSMLQYELGMGDKALYRRLKQLTGLSPVEYIRHIRMNRAALLLKEGRFSVSEVMYMVGFSNSSYFSKCFQSAYGMSPTKYKKQENLAHPI